VKNVLKCKKGQKICMSEQGANQLNQNPQTALLNVNEAETFSRAPWLMVWVGSMSVASPECTPASSTCSVIA